MLSIVRRTLDLVKRFQEKKYVLGIINIETTWYFQPPSPHQVLYTLSHVTTLLTTEIHRNTFGIFFVALFVFTVPWLVLWT
jgi:hypothetical protein